MGANRDFVLNRIPHIAALMVDDINGVLEHGQTIVIGNKAAECSMVREGVQHGQYIVDLVRLTKPVAKTEPTNASAEAV